MHVLRSILRESAASVVGREVEVAGWLRQDGTKARLDVSFAAAGHRTFVDVTVRHPRASKYVQEASQVDGGAATQAERQKRQRYPARPEAGLQAAEPFCVESFGRFGAVSYAFDVPTDADLVAGTPSAEAAASSYPRRPEAPASASLPTPVG